MIFEQPHRPLNVNYSKVHRNILEHLWKDAKKKIIPMQLLVEVARDIRKAIYGHE